MTVPLNPEAGLLLLPWLDRIPAPSRHAEPCLVPAQGPPAARLSGQGPACCCTVTLPVHGGPAPPAGRFPSCKMGQGCTRTPWSPSSTPGIPMLPTRISRSYWRHSLAERQGRADASSEEKAPRTSDHPLMQLSWLVHSFNHQIFTECLLYTRHRFSQPPPEKTA